MPKIKKIYFFADPLYWRYDLETDKVEDGWPKKILDEWRRWPSSFGSPEKTTGALNARNGCAYFFFGKTYYRFDMPIDRMYVGPEKVADFWPGIGADLSIDAAVRIDDDVVCLFHDRSCTRFSMRKNHSLQGYPKRITDDWPGMPDAKVNGALNYGDGNVYLFAGNQYTRFDLAANHAVAPPAAITSKWHGLPGGNFDAAIEFTEDDMMAACVPVYDPAFWNGDRDVRISNNCYNYGCNRALKGFSNPGRSAGKDVANAKTPEDIDALVRLDGLVPVNPDQPLPGCTHLIMMFYGGVPFNFHFYHRNSDGTWSHKIGHEPVKNVDESNNRITDPRTANRGGFVTYCGTYRVDRSKVRLV